MYTMLLWLCGALAAGIFGVMLYSLATFRTTRRDGAAAYRHSSVVEVLWALVPVAILGAAAAPAVRDHVVQESRALASLQSQPTSTSQR